MFGFRTPREAPAYFDTPRGIRTAGGVQLGATVPMLEDFAGPVLRRTGLDELVRRVEVWLDSGRILALAILPFAILALPTWVAVGLTLGVYVAWEIFAPSFPSRSGVAFFRALGAPLVQVLVYVLVLSWVGTGGDWVGAAAGLVGFVAFRLGGVAALLKPLLARAWQKLYALPVPDQVLRALIVREATTADVKLPELASLEQRAKAFWSRKH